MHDIFEGRELLEPHRPAGMEAPSGDADLGPHAELATVGELGRGIVQHNGAVDAGEEFLGCVLVLGDDHLGVLRAVARDVIDGFVEPIHHAHGDDGVEIFGGPIVLAR